MDTTNFELWAQEVLAHAKGLSFEPTGGMHDGGQDGYIREVSAETSHFIQISKQKDTSAKIRQTVRRLIETREIKKLTYLTSQVEAERDLLEARLSDELSVEVVIHDQRWLMVRAKLDEVLRDSLFAYSKDVVEGLRAIQSADRKLGVSSRLSIVAYLEAHVRSLPGSENFQNICLDTLIYNALADTDPEQDRFKTTGEIEGAISADHPNVLAKADSSLEERLAFLSSKGNDPRIRSHPGERYALPYSVRSSFDEDNLRLETDKDKFMGSINSRFNQLVGCSNISKILVMTSRNKGFSIILNSHIRANQNICS